MAPSTEYMLYLADHRIKKGEAYTHTRIGDKHLNIYGGTYNIENETQFLKWYYNEIVKNKVDEYLTEKQLEGDNKRLVVDIDMRYEESIKTRQHNKNHITDLISMYIYAIQELCEINNGYTIEVFIMEKPNVNCLENVTKDGIHLMFGIALNVDIQNTIREDVIKKLDTIWGDLPLVNTMEQVVDEAIMKGSANWQLYGSKKPNNEAYCLTGVENWIWNEDKQDWDIKKIENFDIKKNFERLSVRCPDVQKGIIQEEAKIITLKNNRDKRINNIDDTDDEEDEEAQDEKIYTKTELQAIIDGLPKEAYICGGGNYCFKMICALKKTNATRPMVKKLCEKAGADYNNEWFRAVWKQDTSNYPYDIKYVKSKSSWKEPSIGCLIDMSLLGNSGNIYANTEYIKIKEKFELSNFFLEDIVAWVCNEKNNDGIKKFLIYSKEQMTNKYSSLKFKHIIKGAETELNFMKYWFCDESILSYKYADVYPPDIKCPNNIYNLWSGFGIENTILPDDYDKVGKTDNIKRLLKILCENDDAIYDYFIKYLAHIFKYPSTKEKISVFFTGEMGVGKSTLKTLLNKLLGNELYTEPQDADKLFSRFNKAFRLNKIMIVLDEAESMKKNAKAICGLITNDVMNIENKNEPLMNNLKCLGRLIIMSDSADIIKIEPTDRRFVISNPFVINNVEKKTEFFNSVYADLDDLNIIRCFYDELLAVDIDKNFNFQLARPITEYYKILKSSNAPLFIKFLYDANIQESLVDNKCSATAMYKHFINWCSCVGIKYETTNTKFGLDIRLNLLKHAFSISGIKKIRCNKGNNYLINIDILKKYIETKFGYIGEE